MTTQHDILTRLAITALRIRAEAHHNLDVWPKLPVKVVVASPRQQVEDIYFVDIMRGGDLIQTFYGHTLAHALQRAYRYYDAKEATYDRGRP